MLGYIAENKGEWAEYVNLEKLLGQPVLLCFSAGAFGSAIEKWTDEEIVSAALEVLREIYDNVSDSEGYSLRIGALTSLPMAHTRTLRPVHRLPMPKLNQSRTVSSLRAVPPMLNIKPPCMARTLRVYARRKEVTRRREYS